MPHPWRCGALAMPRASGTAGLARPG